MHSAASSGQHGARESSSSCLGKQRTATSSVTTSSFVSFWMDCTSIADRKVKRPSVFASTRETQPVSWYDCSIHYMPNEIETWYTRKLPLDVLYWMKTWWARSPNILAVPSFNNCTVTEQSRTTAVTLGSSDWVWATLTKHSSNSLLLLTVGVTCPYQITREDMLGFHDGRTHPGFRNDSDNLCRVLQIRPDHSL